MSYYPERRRQPQYPQPRQRQRRSLLSGWKIRLIIAGAIILFSAISFISTSSINPITGQKQWGVAMSPEQEIEVGRNAAIGMVQQHGGLSRVGQYADHVARVGARLVSTVRQRLQQDGKQLPYPFDFHLLADQRTINAFALPGGQVFLTEALYTRMTKEGQLAGVLGHEIGHVLERHGAEQMGRGKLLQGIAGAAGVAGGSINSTQMASMALNAVNSGYGREAELESDRWGVEIMTYTGYDPHHMLDVMEILKEATGGQGAPPEWMSSHPKPENRQKYIQDVIAERFPNGLPPGLR